MSFNYLLNLRPRKAYKKARHLKADARAEKHCKKVIARLEERFKKYES